MHPFNTVELEKLCNKSGVLTTADFTAIKREASFTFYEFFDELHNLATAAFYYSALKKAREDRDTYLARSTYYRGNYYKDGLPFFEKYRNIEDDREYLRRIDEDYPELLDKLIFLFPKFQMSLQVNEDTGRVGIYSHLGSVFDIAWLLLPESLQEKRRPRTAMTTRALL